MFGNLKKLNIVLVIFILINLFYPLSAAIHREDNVDSIVEILSFDQATEVFEKANQDTFVFFDVDDTLISSSDAFARGGNFPLLFRVKLFLKHPTVIIPSIWENYYSIMWDQAPRFLIEPEVAITIQELKQKGSKVYALTSIETGAYGVINDFPKWRYDRLKNLGVEFSQDHQNIIFDSLPSYRSNYPMFHKGILCANQLDKGLVLKSFIECTETLPKKIVFFDDSIAALEQVSRACKEMNIECSLFHYKGALKISGEWNTDRALKQVNYLITEKCWIEDGQLQ